MGSEAFQAQFLAPRNELVGSSGDGMNSLPFRFKLSANLCSFLFPGEMNQLGYSFKNICTGSRTYKDFKCMYKSNVCL